jgi:hypothetical protein
MPTVRDTIAKLKFLEPDQHIAYGALWMTDDVIGYAKNEMGGINVTYEEAENILDDIHDHVDNEMGITWLTIQCAIEDYPLSDPGTEIIKSTQISSTFQKSSKMWSIILDALKVMGNYKEALSYMEERLTENEYYEIEHFFDWLTSNIFTIGHGNYFDRYLEYKREGSDPLTQLDREEQ